MHTVIDVLLIATVVFLLLFGEYIADRIQATHIRTRRGNQ